MSHFSVGVLVNKFKAKKEIEELFAPYRENNMGDCDEKYLEFVAYNDEEIEEYREDYEKFKEEYSSVEDFMERYHNFDKDKVTGKLGYYINPNARWDWYSIGGRWSNALLTKDGIECGFAKLKDIDWIEMQKRNIKKAEKVWDSNPSGLERFLIHGIEGNDTKASFVKRKAEFTTYAFVTSDGEWHSKGNMGWFGISNETSEEAGAWNNNYYNNFIKDKDEDLLFVIIDCHI